MLRTAFVTEYHQAINGFRLAVTQTAISPAEREAAYNAALAFVDWLEPDGYTWRLSGHYRNRAGELLTTLDQVCQAIEEDNLM